MEFQERLQGAWELAESLGYTLKFVTLTWRHWVNHERVHLDLAHLVQGIRRRYGYCEYAKVPERTQRGVIHLHLAMVMPYVPQRVLSAMWKSYTRGTSYIVDIRAVADVVQLRNELAKYLTKGPAGKVSYSRQFPAAKEIRVQPGPCEACDGREHIFQFITVQLAAKDFPLEEPGRVVPGMSISPFGVARSCGCWPPGTGPP